MKCVTCNAITERWDSITYVNWRQEPFDVVDYDDDDDDDVEKGEFIASKGKSEYQLL